MQDIFSNSIFFFFVVMILFCIFIQYRVVGILYFVFSTGQKYILCFVFVSCTRVCVCARVGTGRGLSGGERLNGIVCHTVALSFQRQNMEQHMVIQIFYFCIFVFYNLYLIICILDFV